MTHYIVELVLWVLFVFFAGCVIGHVLRRTVGRDVVAGRTVAPVVEMPAAEPAPASASAPLAEPIAVAPAAAPEPGRMQRPRGLSAARGGMPDNLQRISGIGPKNEKVLHNLGFFHFDQIAHWTPEQIVWIDDHLKFNGRIGREEWVKQAALLAAGKEDEFKSQFGGGRRG
jgi:predicted flap endonuclease-1-like 5' DNA nuclease